jgi:hypothetical protein
VDRLDLRQAGYLVLEVEFPPLELGELEVVGAGMREGIGDFTLQRPVLLFEIG